MCISSKDSYLVTPFYGNDDNNNNSSGVLCARHFAKYLQIFHDLA